MDQIWPLACFIVLRAKNSFYFLKRWEKEGEGEGEDDDVTDPDGQKYLLPGLSQKKRFADP